MSKNNVYKTDTTNNKRTKSVSVTKLKNIKLLKWFHFGGCRILFD